MQHLIIRYVEILKAQIERTDCSIAQALTRELPLMDPRTLNKLREAADDLNRIVQLEQQRRLDATEQAARSLTEQVQLALNRIYDIDTTYEYPGYIAIPERCVNDDTDGSDNVWNVGPDGPDGMRDAWTGQLMTADGSKVVGEMSFVVYPQSETPDTIAAAIYTHGIGDLYTGGGCSDKGCPRINPAQTQAALAPLDARD